MTKTTLINNTVCGGYCLWCGDDSGANEMVGMENLSAKFLLQYVITLLLLLLCLLVETRRFCDSCL